MADHGCTFDPGCGRPATKVALWQSEAAPVFHCDRPLHAGVTAHVVLSDDIEVVTVEQYERGEYRWSPTCSWDCDRTATKVVIWSNRDGTRSYIPLCRWHNHPTKAACVEGILHRAVS